MRYPSFPSSRVQTTKTTPCASASALTAERVRGTAARERMAADASSRVSTTPVESFATTRSEPSTRSRVTAGSEPQLPDAARDVAVQSATAPESAPAERSVRETTRKHVPKRSAHARQESEKLL